MTQLPCLVLLVALSALIVPTPRPAQDEGSKRPQEPELPYPFEELEVAYPGEDGVHLEGTLTLPRSSGPHPALYLIPGGSPFDRDQSLMGHKTFLVLADFLTREGFAVLRMDDRGIGGSEGSKMSVGVDVLCSDVLQGVSFLRSIEEVDPSRIGVLGHSAGAILGPIVAARDGDLAAVVMLAGVGRTFAENIALQQAAQGVGSASVNLAFTRQLLEVLMQESSVKDALTRAAEAWDEAIVGLPEEERSGAEEFTESLTQAVRSLTATPMLRDLLTVDVRPSLQTLECPVLALGGSRDPMSVGLPAIAGSLGSGRTDDYGVLKLPNLNHLFQTTDLEGGGGPQDWARIEETFSPLALDLIGDWLEVRLRQ